MPLKVHLVAGARPNFMKIAPLWHALAREPEGFQASIVHTGQHRDPEMSDVFFEQFRLPRPHHTLQAGGTTHAEQTAAVMIAYEQVCLNEGPDWVVVVGDVNSTLACTLVAKKLVLPVAHLEAGLRSFDRSMPEEVNRLATDSLADLLWTPSPDADQNLANEGAPPDRIERIGNVMIDTFEFLRGPIAARQAAGRRGLPPRSYAVVTFHRPSNVDAPVRLSAIVDALQNISADLPVVFPVHPRTQLRLTESGLLTRLQKSKNILLEPPLDYLEFMSLVGEARLVVTDSGGVQEETTYLGIPCLTLRDNTERPITVTQGSNRLIDLASLERRVRDALGGPVRLGSRPELWDGHAAERAAASLARHAGV